MSIVNDIFRQAGLKPNTKHVAVGYCQCDPRTKTMLYRIGKVGLRCDVCLAINQGYPNADGGVSRLTDGSMLLISPNQIQFWGKSKLNQINPRIVTRPSSGELTNVVRELVLHPPATPWLVYMFSKSNSFTTLRVTEDNRLLRFGGKMQMRRRLITEIHRDQVMQLYNVGMTAKEWDAYMAEYVMHKSRTVIDGLERKYPKLTEIRWIPPAFSAEAMAVSLILQSKRNADA